MLQGGARLQFSMIPMNLMGEARRSCDYIVTGSWSKYAAQEAVKFGETRIVWDGKPTNYDRLPAPSDLRLDPKAAYVYYASNETIQGVQFSRRAGRRQRAAGVRRVERFFEPAGRHAEVRALLRVRQKNAGPAGLTVVIIRKDLLQRSSDKLPGYLNFQIHAEAQSLWNTAPTFPIYVLMLVTKWLITDIGGLANDGSAKPPQGQAAVRRD